MNILLVVDQFFSANNGMTVSARRFTETLRKHGHTVRIVCTENPEDPELSCQRQKIPVFDKLVLDQGMKFAHTNKETLKKGIAWADVIHFQVPFALSHNGIKLAKKMQKPCTSAFHVQPENITSSIFISGIKPVNTFIYWWFRQYFYKYCSYIHCPTDFIADQLRRHHYKGKIFVVSNGVDPDFTYIKKEKPEELKDKFVILTSGRYSVEKRQEVLIRAVKYSKYKDRIQLILAGQGPRRRYLYLLAKRQKLAHPPIMKFMTKAELMDTIATSDLYVHCAESEIEGMSCIEAFCGGLVPVIAESSKSAAAGFAIHEKSLFPKGKSKELAKRIDYWIEHPEEKAEYEKLYSLQGEKFNIDNCVYQIEGMYREAMYEAAGR